MNKTTINDLHNIFDIKLYIYTLCVGMISIDISSTSVNYYSTGICSRAANIENKIMYAIFFFFAVLEALRTERTVKNRPRREQYRQTR